MLALVGLVNASGKTKAETDWPPKVEFTMDYLSGTARAGISDDNLAYYGSMINSEMTLRCVRKKGTRSYDCSIIHWRSWVVDNYDWEGDKKFGGNNPIIRWILPTQKQMNRLTKINCAKSYQRSSRSWQMPQNTPAWNIEFVNDEEVAYKAKTRREKITNRSAQQKKETEDGALPVPGPAEELQKQTPGYK